MAVSLNSATSARIAAAPARTVPVWDAFVRVFHWSFVLAVTLALVSGLALSREWMALHLVTGIAATALLAARVVWGFAGTAYARFAGFVRGPRAILDHLRHLRDGHGHRHRGHNPLGAAMVVALLLVVAALAVTGAVALGGALKTGPLAFAASFATGEQFRELHEVLANLLIGLIVLHIGGAIFEGRRTRENLVAAMIDGRKAARAGDEVPPPARAHPVAAAAIVAVLLAGSAAIIVGLSQRPAAGVPSAALDPAYKAACGDCHIAYHPSLLPAASWTATMDGLTRHFGENATLDPEEDRAVRAYLVANAAEAFDTRPANRLRRVDPAQPLRITAAPFWRRTHDDIPNAVFATKAVGGRGNCAACHGDAEKGLFNPLAIDIPEGAKP